MAKIFKPFIGQERKEKIKKQLELKQLFSDQSNYSDYLKSIFLSKVGYMYGYSESYENQGLKVPFLKVKIVDVYGIPKFNDSDDRQDGVISFNLEVLEVMHDRIYKASDLLQNINNQKRKKIYETIKKIKKRR